MSVFSFKGMPKTTKTTILKPGEIFDLASFNRYRYRNIFNVRYSQILLSKAGLLRPSWIFEALVSVHEVVMDSINFVHDFRGWWATFCDTKEESQDGNKEFGNPGRRGRRRSAEAWFKGFGTKIKLRMKNIVTCWWKKEIGTLWISSIQKTYCHYLRQNYLNKNLNVKSRPKPFYFFK